MRILRIAQTYYPDVSGGGAYHVHALSRDQAALGHDVTVLTVRRSPESSRLAKRDGYTVLRRDPTTSLLGNELSVGLARKLWDTDGFDVVHAHSHLYFSTNLAALRRRLGDTPLAITNHGLYSQSAPRWLFDYYLRTIGRATFDSADIVFCYTETDRKRLRKRGVRAPVAVVNNGIDTTQFTPEGPADERVRGDPAILFVGRLVDGKRPSDAISALEHLLESHPSARLTVVGEGPLAGGLRRRVTDAGVADAVSFLGYVDYDRMPAVYRAADALVLPSVAEGFPRTIMESLATATPVVASALDQLQAIEGRGILTVPVGDTAGFADALRSVLGDDDDGRNGRPLVEERFDWRETVARVTDHLEHLVAERP